jgi:hypothetical protein
MGTIRSYFSDPFSGDDESFGVITGSFNLSRLPNVPGKLFSLQARNTNPSSIFIGNARSTGTYPANPTLPMEIRPGDLLGWFSATNLNQYYMAGCSGSVYLSYWAQG